MADVVDAAPAGDVRLCRLLRHPVRGDRPQRRVLGGRGHHLAVDRAPGGREDDRGTGCARRLEHVERAEDVHLGVEDRLLHRRSDVGLRSQVEHEVGVERERFADVVLDQLRAGIDELTPSRGQVVDDGHLVAARDERVDDV